MSLNIFPSLSAFYIEYSSRTNSVFFSELFIRMASVSPYCQSLGSGYCSQCLRLTSGFSKSSLICRILGIFFECSAKKMIWIAAWRIVAAVKYISSQWYRSIGQFVRNSVGRCELGIDSHRSVSFFTSATRPLPALIWIFNVHSFPKSGRATDWILKFFNVCSSGYGGRFVVSHLDNVTTF